jgi:hypothetical protein
VRVLPQERRSTNDDIDTINTSLDSDPGIVHVTSNVCENLGPLETHLTDSFTVCS